jgi:tRNA (guanine26-N2/guanine27-N2)-dimethyltransferase
MYSAKPVKRRDTSLSDFELIEGKAHLSIPTSSKVFYNRMMNLNRDIAILFASSHFPSPRQLRVCDPMTASGVRAVRYALETRTVLTVLAADNKPETVQVAKANIALNQLGERVTVLESDANSLLVSHVKERFDLVDLDPFGSPAPFFENTLRATIDGGVIAAAATDMGPLTGARAAACVRKYGVWPVRSEFEKEMAVRILAACLEIIAGRLELGINIAFAHASDHYARIYAQVNKGRRAANLSSKSIAFLEYCPTCLRRNAHSRPELIRTSCEDCGGKTVIGGPIWTGPIWDADTVRAMIERTPTLDSPRLSEIQNILTRIIEEHQAPAFHYTTDAFSRILALKPPALRRVLSALAEAGFSATRTHFSPNGFRTDAPCKQIGSIFRALADEA